MTKKTYWHTGNTPVETTLDRILYDIRKDDKEGLIFDSISIHDIIEDSDGVLALDALITPYAKLEAKMSTLQKVMERSGTDVKPVNLTISEPFMRNGVANVAAVFELSDGQGVTIFFHNPDVTPKKMMATDELISWKWLLNKKDITIVVAPEKGVDLNIRQVAVRIMKLAQKNSAAFLRVNAKSAERKQVIDDLKTEISDLENELKQAQNNLEVAKVEKDDREIAAVANPVTDPEIIDPTPETIEPVEPTKPDLNSVPKDLFNSIGTIMAIDDKKDGYAGYDRALFVSSLTGKLKTMHKNGQQKQVDDTLNTIEELQKDRKKPILAAKNSTWGLHSKYGQDDDEIQPAPEAIEPVIPPVISVELEKMVEKFDKALGAFTLQETFDNYKNGSVKSIAEGLHTESEVEQHFLKKYELNSITDIQAFDELRLQKKQAAQAELTVAQAKTAQIISDAINKYGKDAIMENLNDVFVGRKSDIDAAVNGQKAFNDAQLEEFNRYLPKEPQNQTAENSTADIDAEIETLRGLIGTDAFKPAMNSLLDKLEADNNEEYDTVIGEIINQHGAAKVAAAKGV